MSLLPLMRGVVMMMVVAVKEGVKKSDKGKEPRCVSIDLPHSLPQKSVLLLLHSPLLHT